MLRLCRRIAISCCQDPAGSFCLENWRGIGITDLHPLGSGAEEETANHACAFLSTSASSDEVFEGDGIFALDLGSPLDLLGLGDDPGIADVEVFKISNYLLSFLHAAMRDEPTW